MRRPLPSRRSNRLRRSYCRLNDTPVPGCLWRGLHDDGRRAEPRIPPRRRPPRPAQGRSEADARPKAQDRVRRDEVVLDIYYVVFHSVEQEAAVGEGEQDERRPFAQERGRDSDGHGRQKSPVKLAGEVVEVQREAPGEGLQARRPTCWP